MYLNYVVNDWESAFFSRLIGRVEFSEKKEQNVPHFHLLQAKVRSDDWDKISLLQQAGFKLVESEVDFCLPLSSQSATVDFIIAQEKDISTLETLVAEAFPFTRFRPPYFSMEENKRFYCTWIVNAVLGKFDDLCLIAKIKDDIIGCISLRLQQQKVRVGLLAVKSSARGKGIATHLLQQAVCWAKAQQAKEMFIATQFSNLAAINLYHKLGAKIVATHYWFYQ